MVDLKKAYRPDEPGMRTPLFRETEIARAEAIAAALSGLDIYSARALLKKMNTYLLLTTFQSVMKR